MVSFSTPSVFLLKKAFLQMKNYTLYTCLLLVFVWATPVFAQKCEDIPALLPQMKEDTNKVNLLWRWAGCYTGNNPDSVVILCKQGLALARKLNFTEGVFKCLARPTASLSRLGRFDEAEKNVKEGQSFARQIRDTFNILRFIDAYCSFNAGQNKLKEVLDLSQEGLNISISTGETYRRPVFYIHLAQTYCSMGDSKKALEASFKALPYSEKSGDKGELALIYSNIAICLHNSQIDPEGIAKYARLAIENGTAVNKKFQVMTAQSLLGQYYLAEKKDSVLAVQYIEQALSTARQMNAQNQIANYLADLGRIYMLMENHNKAISYLEEAAQMLESDTNSIFNAQIKNMVVNNLADGYFHKKDYEKAIQIYENLLKSNPNAIPVNEVWSLLHLAEAYSNTGKHEKAYTTHVRYKILSDSILSAENAVRAKDLESVYLLGKKEVQLKLSDQEKALANANFAKQTVESQRQRLLAEQQRLLVQSTETARQLLERENQLKDFELRDQADSLNYQQLQVNFEKTDKAQKLAEAALFQETEASKRRWAIGILSGLLLLSGIGFYAWRIRQKAISDKKLAESELKALRSQLNPHFLFNSMNAINGYILDNDRLKASEYLAQFAGVMRGILETSRNTTVRLEKELEWLESYIKIEQKRFSKPFDYQIRVDKTIDTFSTQVPAMLLQPFVENAIWHGFLNKPTKGHLTIDAKQQNGQLIFTIEDDGIGRQKAATLNAKRDSKQSLGVKISEERLHLINNPLDNNNILIKDLVDTEGVPCGTQVVIAVRIR
jgi:tetratricopeptide (TPR) repeat protein